MQTRTHAYTHTRTHTHTHTQWHTHTRAHTRTHTHTEAPLHMVMIEPFSTGVSTATPTWLPQEGRRATGDGYCHGGRPSCTERAKTFSSVSAHTHAMAMSTIETMIVGHPGDQQTDTKMLLNACKTQ